ncbi:MAG: ArsR/SmtB family transcription factor [Halopenitus sp.]
MLPVRMSSPISRLTGSTAESETDPAVLRMDEEEASAVFDALGSETARRLFCAAAEKPAPPSELARQVDTSVQNVHYHLSNLQSAGVVEPLDTEYSEKGNEMTVYGPTTDPIVLTGEPDAESKSGLRRSVQDWAAGVVGLAFASLAVQVVVERLTTGSGGLFEPASVGGADPGEPIWLALTVAEPGLLFFVGGLAAFAAVAVRTGDE